MQNIYRRVLVEGNRTMFLILVLCYSALQIKKTLTHFHLMFFKKIMIVIFKTGCCILQNNST